MLRVPSSHVVGVQSLARRQKSVSCCAENADIQPAAWIGDQLTRLVLPQRHIYALSSNTLGESGGTVNGVHTYTCHMSLQSTQCLIFFV